ncbi:MAG: hypothetical protein ACNA8W_24365 [Bradymonadaceae bacterium]
MNQTTEVSHGHFTQHLLDAIDINRGRTAYYASVTKNRSRKLSNRLVIAERFCLPMARYFDKKARPFNAKGIGVVRDDFVAMEDIRAPETPPLYSGLASDAEWKDCKRLLSSYQRAVCAANKAADFAGVCELTIEPLHAFEEREATLGAHFTMVKHILESIGFAALNAQEWARLSDGASVALSQRLIYVQARPVAVYITYDKLAQPLHAEGCGILVNDIPPIPFLERLGA